MILKPDDLDWRGLVGPLSAADDALARLDERLRTSPYAEGWRARMDFREAAAALWLTGDLVDLDALVLRDQNMDGQRPTLDVLRAQSVLWTRRRLSRLAAPLTRDNVIRLVGDDLRVAASVCDDSDSFRPDYGSERRDLDLWLRQTEHFGDCPPVLAAAAAWALWSAINPLPRAPWMGPQLAAWRLHRRGRAHAHLPALALGLRLARSAAAGRPPRRPSDSLNELVLSVEKAAHAGLDQLNRLSLAAEILLRRAGAETRRSRLSDLVDLALREPLVTVPLIARRLKISQQAAQSLVSRAGSSLRELSGRDRYRAWAIL